MCHTKSSERAGLVDKAFSFSTARDGCTNSGISVAVESSSTVASFSCLICYTIYADVGGLVTGHGRAVGGSVFLGACDRLAETIIEVA